MKIKDIIAPLEVFAPLSLQAAYDNSGLLVGDVGADVGSALVCVDVTEAVVDEAIEVGAGLIISHHPLIFNPLRHITGGTYIERALVGAIRHGVAIYACHTNLDAASGGMSWRMGSLLGLREVMLLDDAASISSSSTSLPAAGFGVVGELPERMPTLKFLEDVKSVLGVKTVRYSALIMPTVGRVALCTGAGASMMQAAKRAGAEVYVSSDFRYNDFLDADRELVIADVGHFESEYCAMGLIYDIITKNIPTFAVRKSVRGVNPVNYL